MPYWKNSRSKSSLNRRKGMSSSRPRTFNSLLSWPWYKVSPSKYGAQRPLPQSTDYSTIRIKLTGSVAFFQIISWPNGRVLMTNSSISLTSELPAQAHRKFHPSQQDESATRTQIGQDENTNGHN